MKKYFINYAIKTVKNNYPNYDNRKLDEIRYGLEGIYLSLSKTIIILIITIILNLFKEAIIFLLFFNFLRLFAFGIHAKKSWQCWLSSIISFIGIPYLCIYIEQISIIHYIVLIISLLTYVLYAPADTVKRPLIKKHRRIKFKLLTILVSFIYIGLFFYTNNIFIKNAIACSMLLEAILIHPFTYWMFKLPYKNYERYVISSKKE